MDAAFRNATARKEKLATEIAQLTSRLGEAEAEVARIDLFLAEWARFAGIEIAVLDENAKPSRSDVVQPAEQKRVRPNNPSKEEVGEHAEAIMMELGQPVGRARLFTELELRGIHLEGTEPQMVLSTMMWRMKDRFERIKGRGYWLKGKPLPEAISAESEMQPEDAGI